MKQFIICLWCVSVLALFLAKLVMAQTLTNLKFVYSPGFGLYNDSINTVSTELRKLYNPDPKAPRFSVSVEGVNATGNNQTSSIRSQVGDLKTRMNDIVNQGGLNNLVLVGQSQGGIRARAYLQLNATAAQRNAIKGFATISSPNLGGPILNNGLAILRREAAILHSGVVLPLLGPFNFLVARPLDEAIKTARDYVDVKSAGVTDMRVGSSLLTQLNNPPKEDCTTTTYHVTQRLLWVTWQEARHVTTCKPKPTPDFQAIPSNTAVMSIVTSNSSPDEMLAALSGGTFSQRTGAAIFLTATAALMWAWAFIPFQWWRIPIAVGLTNAAIFLWRLPAIYNEAVGSNRHDGLFPQANQVMPRSAGGWLHRVSRLENALHDYDYDPSNPTRVKGALGRYAGETARYLAEFEIRVRTESR